MVWELLAGAAVSAGLAAAQGWQHHEQQKRAARAAASQAFGGPRVRPSASPAPTAPQGNPVMATGGVPAGAAAGAAPFSALPDQRRPAEQAGSAKPAMNGITNGATIGARGGEASSDLTASAGAASPGDRPFWQQAAMAGAGVGALAGMGLAAYSANPRPDKVGGMIPGYRGIPGGGVLEEEQRQRQLSSFLSSYRPQGPGQFGVG